MTKSDSISKLATALNKVQSEMTPVVKNASNPFFRSSYADLTAVWEHIRKPLTKEGLSVCQTTDNGNLITTLMHTSGEWISGSYSLVCAKQNDPMALGSSMSYARRYALAAIVGAVAETEDDDGNTASDKRVTTKPTVTPVTVTTIAPVIAPVASDIISAAQVTRLQTIAREQGLTPPTMKAYLKTWGYDSSKQIKKTDYTAISRWCERGGQDEPVTDNNEDLIPM